MIIVETLLPAMVWIFFTNLYSHDILLNATVILRNFHFFLVAIGFNANLPNFWPCLLTY